MARSARRRGLPARLHVGDADVGGGSRRAPRRHHPAEPRWLRAGDERAGQPPCVRPRPSSPSGLPDDDRQHRQRRRRADPHVATPAAVGDRPRGRARVAGTVVRARCIRCCTAAGWSPARSSGRSCGRRVAAARGWRRSSRRAPTTSTRSSGGPTAAMGTGHRRTRSSTSGGRRRACGRSARRRAAGPVELGQCPQQCRVEGVRCLLLGPVARHRR